MLIRVTGGRRLRLGVWDRAFWVILAQGWAGWKEALAIEPYAPRVVVRCDVDGRERIVAINLVLATQKLHTVDERRPS